MSSIQDELVLLTSKATILEDTVDRLQKENSELLRQINNAKKEASKLPELHGLSLIAIIKTLIHKLEILEG